MPGDISAELAERVKARRKELDMSQSALAKKSGVSLGSLRRFEQHHEISLTSLINIAFALGCENDFDALFATPRYASLDAMEKSMRRQRRQTLKRLSAATPNI